MKTYEEIRLSFESVAVQRASPLYHALLAEVRQLRKLYNASSGMLTDGDFIGLNKIIRDPKLCGLNVTVYAMGPQTPSYARENSFCTTPMYLTQNYQVMGNAGSYRPVDLLSALMKEHGKIQAGYNPRTGQVSGLFAKVPVPIWFETAGFIEGARYAQVKQSLTDEALVCIVLHEIGHSIGIIASISDNMAKSSVMALMARDWANSSEEERYVLVNQLAKYMTVPYNEKVVATIAAAEDEAAVVATIGSLFHEHPISPVGSMSGDRLNEYTAEEFLADAYAIRMSGGRVEGITAVAGGPNKYRDEHASAITKAAGYFGACATIIAAGAGAVASVSAMSGIVVFAGLMGLGLFNMPDAYTTTTKVPHGDITARLTNARQQLVQMLKADLKLTLPEKRYIMDTLKHLDGLIHECEDSTVTQYLYGLNKQLAMLDTDTRNAVKLREVMDGMTALMHNSVHEKLNEYDVLIANRGK